MGQLAGDRNSDHQLGKVVEPRDARKDGNAQARRCLSESRGFDSQRWQNIFGATGF